MLMFKLFIVLTIFVILNYVITFLLQECILSSKYVSNKENTKKKTIFQSIIKLAVVIITYLVFSITFALIFKLKVLACVISMLIIISSYIITEFLWPYIIKKFEDKNANDFESIKVKLVGLEQLIHTISIIWATLGLVNIPV